MISCDFPCEICTFFLGVHMIVKFSVGNTIEMKKKHPCGSVFFKVLYSASDVKIRCCGCKRELVLPRVKLEHNIKSVIVEENND